MLAISALVAHFPAIQNLNPGPPTARDGSMTPPRRRSTRWRVDSSQRLLRNICRPAHDLRGSACRSLRLSIRRPSGCCNQKACGHPPTSEVLCFRNPGSGSLWSIKCFNPRIPGLISDPWCRNGMASSCACLKFFDKKHLSDGLLASEDEALLVGRDALNDNISCVRTCTVFCGR